MTSRKNPTATSETASATPSKNAALFDQLDPKHIRVESARKLALDVGRRRLMVTGVVFALAFLALSARLVELTAFGSTTLSIASFDPYIAPASLRGDIRDRSGILIATSLPTQSLYADPGDIFDAEEAAQKLSEVLPNITPGEVRVKLSQGGRFAWIARNLTPEQVYTVNRLGLPGFGFRTEERRIYPFGPIFAHVLGYTDVDGRGIAGAERTFEKTLNVEGGSLDTSLDLRIQTVLHEELASTVKRFNAIGGAGVVLDVNTGEILALVSLPDFDPNEQSGALGRAGFNRATKGVYEMGSTFKLFTTAMALDTGVVGLQDGYDVSDPLKAARFTINDFHGKKRWLSIPEILVYSSNIGSARMALDVGAERQKEYLYRFGLLSPSTVELPEIGTPLFPDRWGEIATMTISYGHGIAVSPLHVASGVAALVNGGLAVDPTIVKRKSDALNIEERVLAPKTSNAMRALMRLVVRFGTGRNADVSGYMVGGKTGTAEKQVGGGYSEDALVSSFVGVFPMSAPRYAVLIVVDEPKGIEETKGYATGGWVAAPAVGRVIRRLGVMAGEVPNRKDTNYGPGTPFYIPAGNKQPAGNTPQGVGREAY